MELLECPVNTTQPGRMDSSSLGTGTRGTSNIGGRRLTAAVKRADDEDAKTLLDSGQESRPAGE